MSKIIIFLMALLSLIADSNAISCGRYKSEQISAPDKGQIYEAEQAEKEGSLRIIMNRNCSDRYCVMGLYNEDDELKFTLDIDKDGLYNLTFVTAGICGDKTNHILIDGNYCGKVNSKDSVFSESSLSAVELAKGRHTVSVKAEWGYICVDKLTVTEYEPIDSGVYNITAELTNKNATTETKELYNYLKSIYGRYTLAGQYADYGLESNEFRAIKEVTGKYPALLGLDMMDYTPVRIAHGSKGIAVDVAKEFDSRGGIVTFCWHWCTPDKYVTGKSDENGEPLWWRSFYTENTNIDIEKIMNGEDKEGLAALDKDIEAIAHELKELEKAGIPILWRPLHEPSGGWFWWGAKGPEAYKKLWIYLYDKLTNTYRCNNLIWVFNDNNPEWYPGDEYVDINSVDIYAEKHNYTPSADEFIKTVNLPKQYKMTALAENGTLYDVNAAAKANVNWLFFATWQGEYAVNGEKYCNKYTEAEMLKDIYKADNVITLDELG